MFILNKYFNMGKIDREYVYIISIDNKWIKRTWNRLCKGLICDESKG